MAYWSLRRLLTLYFVAVGGSKTPESREKRQPSLAMESKWGMQPRNFEVDESSGVLHT